MARRASLLLAIVALASGQRAFAQPRAPLRVVAGGQCPDATSVVSQLRTLFPALDAVAVNERPGPDAVDEDAVIAEQSDGIVVSLAGARRAFTDPGARCAERARFAAVFLAVTLYPPQFATPEPAPAPTPRAAPASTLDVQIGPTFLVAPAAEQSTAPTAIGGGARILAAPADPARHLALTAGVSVLSSTLRDPRADAQGLWIPVDVGARLALAHSRLEAAAEASLVVAPVRLRGQNVATAEDGWRVQAGLRAALTGRVWLTERIAAGIAGFGYGWPNAVRLDLGGAGPVGHTPRLWLGGELSLTVRLR